MHDYLLAAEDHMSWAHLEDQYYSEPEYDEVIQECEWCETEQDGWRLNADEWDCLTCRTVQPLTRF